MVPASDSSYGWNVSLAIRVHITTKLHELKTTVDASRESSHGRFAVFFPELLTCGAQYIIRNMISKKKVCATSPTFPCTSPEAIVQAK